MMQPIEPDQETDQPLTEKELDELESFLDSDRVPESCMNLEMLDGFLTAIASGPDPIGPGEWLLWVWSESASAEDQPEFGDEEEFIRIVALMFRRLNEIVSQLMEAPEAYTPFWYEESQDDQVPLAFNWAQGYVTAIGMRAEAWKPLQEKEEYAEVLMPIYVLSAPADHPDYGDFHRNDEERREVVDMLPACVTAIHRYWLARREGPLRREGPKIGRNDPCPCGSGRKYKQCCGRQ